MKKRIVFIHSVPGTILSMKRAFLSRYPEAEVFNIMDDGLLPEVGEHDGAVTPAIVTRLAAYAHFAQDYGASAVMCMCTTVTPAADLAAPSVSIPFLKIDAPMMDEAVRAGRRIALVCTAQYTVKPSMRALHLAADKAGKTIEADPVFVDHAFDILQTGDKETHDRLVVEQIRKAAATHDAIVLAQVSMVDLPQQVADLKVPILTSVESGMEQLRPYVC